jgi:uncharacterized protein YkwD
VKRWIVLLIAPVFLVSCGTLQMAFTQAAAPPAPAAPAAPAAKPSPSPRWKPEVVDTAAGAAYLSAVEQQVIQELNKARTDPPAYAREYLLPLRSLFHGKLLEYPGEVAIQTNEGVAALEEAIRVLSAAAPLPPLSPAKGITQAARAHAADQGKTGATGHTGADRSTLPDRLNRFGRWSKAAGENIDYGNADARRIVPAFLIDDGVPSRGHRTNLMSGDFAMVGVAVGPHPLYGHMCVMDFAGGWLDARQ